MAQSETDRPMWSVNAGFETERDPGRCETAYARVDAPLKFGTPCAWRNFVPSGHRSPLRRTLSNVVVRLPVRGRWSDGR